MLEECHYLPPRSLSSLVGTTVRALRGSRLAPSFLKPPGPPRAFLNGVRKQCLGVGVGGEIGVGLEGGGLVLVTSSFGIEPPRPLPPYVKLIGRGHRPETADALEEHAELKVRGRTPEKCDSGDCYDFRECMHKFVELTRK